MSDVKKALLLWGVSFVVGFYCVFVMQQLWNWFAVPLLHFGEASFLAMYGLNLLVGLLTARDIGDNPMHESRWRRALIVMNACVPVGSREMMMEELKEEDDQTWTNLGTWIFGLAFGYTLSLGIGFLVHAFA